LEWPGFVWDLKIGSVEIPDRKMAHLIMFKKTVLKNPDRVIARTLASIIGQIISMSFVLPKQIPTIPIYNLVPKRFFTHSLQNLQILNIVQ
jgi:hypothetical protein